MKFRDATDEVKKNQKGKAQTMGKLAKTVIPKRLVKVDEETKAIGTYA